MRLALTHDDGTVIAYVTIGPARWIDANVDSHIARELLNDVDAKIPGGNPLTVPKKSDLSPQSYYMLGRGGRACR